MKLKYLLFIFCFLFALSSHAQTKETLDSLSKNYQICLDSGIDMKSCSINYYNKMDSMLNFVYNKLRKQLSSAEQNALKLQQIQWLQKRDNYFVKQDEIFYKKIKSGEWGRDMRMIPIDNKAKFVEKRVLVLLNKIK